MSASLLMYYMIRSFFASEWLHSYRVGEIVRPLSGDLLAKCINGRKNEVEYAACVGVCKIFGSIKLHKVDR